MKPNLPQFNSEAAKAQLDRTERLARILPDASWTVDSSHTSKSILLPVPTIRVHGISFTFRDNFYDLNLLVQSEKEINVPLSFFYQPLTYEWYMEVVADKRGYTFHDWSDDEMNDPRILRVQRKNGNGWSEVNGEAKDRWYDRMKDTSWYNRDWSSGRLLFTGPSDPFSEATTFYDARTAYAEGIKEHASPYIGPCTKFLNCVSNWQELARICLGLSESVV